MQNLSGCDFFSDETLMVKYASTLTYVFYQKKITFTLGFSLGQHPSGNLQPFGGKNYPIRHQLLRIYASDSVVSEK